MDAADRNHRGSFGDIELSARDHLQSGHDLGCDDYGVHSRPRGRTVRLTSLYLDVQPVGRGQHSASAIADDARGKGQHVKTEDRLRFRGLLEHTLADHQAGPAFFTHRRAFLRRLKDELDGAWEIGARTCQNFGRSHQDRNVVVVTTCMHHPHFGTVVLGPDFGSERKIDALGYGKRVHVRA